MIQEIKKNKFLFGFFIFVVLWFGAMIYLLHDMKNDVDELSKTINNIYKESLNLNNIRTHTEYIHYTDINEDIDY